ncbi:MAG TPA: hypothetical protein VF723_17440 [Pyrinomonadaceae bacterium]|jgi:hypothetical protein
MKSIHLKNKIGGVLLGATLLLGIGAAPSTSVQGQWGNDRDRQDRRDQRRRDRDWRRGRNNGGRYDDGYGDYGGSFQLRQTALNAGANLGVKAGRKDRQRGERYEFRDEGDYQKATKDYSSRLGDREIYRQYFREAFEHGYADGYSGY